MQAGRSSVLVVDVLGVSIIPLTLVDLVPTDGMVDNESGTLFESPHVDIDAPEP